MASKKLIFALTVFSVFIVTQTSLLGGVVKTLGLNAILPCRFVVDFFLGTIRLATTFSMMVETAIELGQEMLKMMTYPVAITLQHYFNVLVESIPKIVGEGTNDECFANMTKRLGEILKYDPNSTIYFKEYLEVVKEIHQGYQDTRLMGELYYERYKDCQNCDCIPILVEVLSEFTFKLSSILVKNWMIDVLAALYNATHRYFTDMNDQVEELTIGVHNVLFDYQRCVGNNIP